MSEGSDDLAYSLMRAVRFNCEVSFMPRREWLGIGVKIRKEHEGLVYENTQIVSEKEMACVSEPLGLLGRAVNRLTNSILDMENAR